MDRRQVLRAGTAAAAALLVGCGRGERETGLDEAAPRGPSTDGVDAPPTADVAPPDPSASPTEPTPTAPPEPETPEPQAETVRIEVLCRDALGLAVAAGGGTAHRIQRVTLHHTGVELGDNALAPSRLRGHQRFHQQHGWPDIAYHYGVDLRGNVYELRRPDLAGDTFTDYDPVGHLLLLCEGNYDVESPTDQQLTSVAQLVAHGAQRYGFDPTSLTGHRDHVITRCPGDALYARLPELAAEGQRLADAAAHELDLRCDDEARRRVAAIEAGT